MTSSKKLISRLLPTVTLLSAVLIFFNKMAFSNLILARGDTFLYFYPYWQMAADALGNGRIPLWNPNIFMGAPFLANSQVGFFYPFNWPVWWLLPTPYAVSASILLHLTIAAWGTYLVGRRVLLLSRGGAWLAAVLFALGGYLTAQIEHINQLQGLAWLPWFFVVMGTGESGRLDLGDWRKLVRRGTAVAILFSLQLLAGHTQTAFITGVGLVVYGVASGEWRRGPITVHGSRFTHHILRFFPLLWGALLAGLLTAVQLLPTLELVQLSSRQGGLSFNEVLSFSLPPQLIGQSLLPAYGQSLFTEYVAFLPISAMVLALIGAWPWRGQQAVRPFIILSILAILLALGRFTPLYWLLARLPGFDLFRVPARWLVLYALGMALLAGSGWEWLNRGRQAQNGFHEFKQPIKWGIMLALLLIVWWFVSVPLARIIPPGPEVAAQYPGWPTILFWGGELGLWILLLLGDGVGVNLKRSWPHLVMIFVIALLFLASRVLPYNNLTTPEAYFDWRPPVSRLKGVSVDAVPLGRLLSLSNIFFDPGDQAEIDTIYQDQLSEAAQYDYTVAIKQKEIIAPNLPMTFGLASADGFDGGLLPIISYSQLATILQPGKKESVDGRLREYLTAVPAAQWLDLFNAQYLITDKTGDSWRTVAAGFDAFFDLQHPTEIQAGATESVGYVPSFPATGLVLIASGEVGVVQIETEIGVREYRPSAIDDDLWLVTWPEPVTAQAIRLKGPDAGQWQVQGLTLINETDHTFQPLVAGQYRLIHSGDVKIYENLDVLPRAFLVHNWQWQPDAAASLSAMRQPSFDPVHTAVLIGQGDDHTGWEAGGQVQMTQYSPEMVTIQVESESEALLVLTDAYYPGWRAALNGQLVPILQVDVLFRAIMIPAGQHEIVFVLSSSSFGNGRWLSLVGLLVLMGLTVSVRMKRNPV